MSGASLQNASPIILEQWQLPQRKESISSDLKEVQEDLQILSSFSLFSNDVECLSKDPEAIDEQEIYDLLAPVSDPEHPLTLGQLAVVQLQQISVIAPESENEIAQIVVYITPTITHCSLATLIGLGLRVRLERSLPPRYRIKVLVAPGSHQSETQVNKQLNDKERVAAACENEQLMNIITKMLETCC